MTRLSRQTLTCPKCNTSFSVVYYASINTWMNPSQAKEFLDGKGYVYNCPSCNQSIRLVYQIIINALKGMFTVSTDASKEERIAKYREFGLLENNNEFKDPQLEWLRQQLTKRNAPPDSVTQKDKQRKIVEELNDTIRRYKSYIEKNIILNDEEEKAFENLRDCWEKEKQLEGIYLHQPSTPGSPDSNSILFYKLWEDLLQLKSRLEKLKQIG